LFHVFTCGPPTGDLHPIYNAPMLGAHKRMHTDVVFRCALYHAGDAWRWPAAPGQRL